MLFGYLAGQRAAGVLAETAAAAGPIALLLLVMAAIWRFADMRHTEALDRRRAWTKGLELTALPLVFVLLPPLLAFTVYWIGSHSLHVLLITISQQPGSGRHAAWLAYRPALPATVAALVLAALAFAALFSGRTAL